MRSPSPANASSLHHFCLAQITKQEYNAVVVRMLLFLLFAVVVAVVILAVVFVGVVGA